MEECVAIYYLVYFSSSCSHAKQYQLEYVLNITQKAIYLAVRVCQINNSCLNCCACPQRKSTCGTCRRNHSSNGEEEKKRSNGRLSDSTALNFMMRIARAPTVPIATSPSSTRSRSELNYIIKQEGHCTCCSPPSTSRPAMTRGATTTSRPIPSRSQPGSHPASRNRTLTSTSHI